MSVTGERKRLKEGIIKILTEWLMMEYYGDYEEVAADIMALVPKTEVTTYHVRETPTLHVRYYVCGRCDYIVLEVPSRYCTYCGRRVIAREDDTIGQ